MSNIIDVLKNKLRRSNMTVVANESGVTVQTLHNFKEGKTRPQQATIDKLCCYFLIN